MCYKKSEPNVFIVGMPIVKPSAHKKLKTEFQDPFAIRWKWLPEVPNNWKYTLSWLFFLSVLVESSFLAVQVEKTYRTESAEDLSLTAMIILMITNCIWILSAVFLLKSYSVLASGILYVSMSGMLIAAIVKYG